MTNQRQKTQNANDDIITVTANFQTSAVYLYINTFSDYGFTEPVDGEYHYFDPVTEDKVNIYPIPNSSSEWGNASDGIPPLEVFDRWEAREGTLQGNDPQKVPLTLTMDRNREIIAHFRKTTREDGGAAITSNLKKNLQWYFSVHDGYYYKDRSSQGSDNDD